MSRKGNGLTNRRQTTPGTMLLWVLILGTGIRLALVHPVQDYLLDFRAYYAAATAAGAGINPYDTEAVRANVTLPGNQQIIGYLYPPPTLWLFEAFAQLPYPAAQVPWLALQFAMAVAALWLILRAFRCEFGSPVSVLVGFAFLGSAAVWELFRWGQFDMIVVLLLTLAIVATLSKHPLTGGAWLGLAAIAKVTPVVYLAVLALRKQWKAVAFGAGVIALLLAAGLIWPGYAATRSWLTALHSFSADTHAAMSPNNLSLHGFVYRLFVAHPTHEGLSVPWFDLGLDRAQWFLRIFAVTLCLATAAWMWLHRHLLSTAECICAAIPLVLLLTPITAAHHCVQMLLPLALILAKASRCERLPTFDALWLTLIVLLSVLGSGGRIESATHPWINHLISPTTTYAIGLTWLFFIARFVPLKLTAAGLVTSRERKRARTVQAALAH